MLTVKFEETKSSGRKCYQIDMIYEHRDMVKNVRKALQLLFGSRVTLVRQTHGNYWRVIKLQEDKTFRYLTRNVKIYTKGSLNINWSKF